MILETERLIIRPWTQDPADLARAVDLYSRPEVIRFLGPFRGPARKMVESWHERMAEDRRQVVAAVEVRATGLVAGTVLYKPLPGEHHMEVGWHLHPDSWGQGYATESARAVVDRGFRLGVPEVFAVVRPDNPKSQAVCRRLGMRHLGRTGRYYDLELELFHLPAPGPRAATRPGRADTRPARTDAAPPARTDAAPTRTDAAPTRTDAAPPKTGRRGTR